MALDTNLLYGEMVGSWLIHMGIPFAVFMFINALPYMDLVPRMILFLVVSALLSGICQAGFLAMLQSSTCGGIKDYRSIGVGAMLCAVITAIMIAIPTFVEPMRLVVSQLFFRHKTLLTPQLAHMDAIIRDTGEKVLKASLTEEKVQTGGAAISPNEYEEQTFQEIAAGASYWGAFAGAYGVGLGSLIAAKCPATA